jgi:hypothetical protein
VSGTDSEKKHFERPSGVTRELAPSWVQSNTSKKKTGSFRLTFVYSVPLCSPCRPCIASRIQAPSTANHRSASRTGRQRSRSRLHGSASHGKRHAVPIRWGAHAALLPAATETWHLVKNVPTKLPISLAMAPRRTLSHTLQRKEGNAVDFFGT